MKKIHLEKHHYVSIGLLALCAACVIYLAGQFLSMRQAEPIYPGKGVTAVQMLSDYYPALKGSHGDTEIYVLDSGSEGPSMLVLGGTHPNEPSGFISAVMLIENCMPESGVLYVIPRTNNSAFTCTDPQEGAPMRFTIQTAGGERWFRFGSRATNPVDQWPDPEVYVHKSSSQHLSGSETRNINRAYPGVTDGNFTEWVAYGITEFIRQKDITITVDLHEASPEYPTINALVAHEDAMLLASQAAMNMQFEGMEIGLEPSPTNLHGLSHRELGDYTGTLALLMETANASQGRLHGKMSSDLVVTGQDKYYYRAGKYGALYVAFPESGISLSERCARHLTGLNQIALAYGEIGGEKGVLSLGAMPSYYELIENGVGAYLNPND